MPGTPPKIVHGARAQLMVDDRLVGLFNSVSFGLAFDTQDAYVLGAYAAAEIGYTGQDTVNITCSGWRVFGNGPHVAAKLPQLQELLNHGYIELAIIDRQTGQRLAKFRSCRPTGYSMSINARQLTEITVTFKGILVDDESTNMAEGGQVAPATFGRLP